MDKLETQLTALAREHDLTVIQEPGFSAPSYRLMSQEDAQAYLALLFYNWEGERLH